MVPMLSIRCHVLVAVYLFDAFTCIIHITYQLGLGRETSEISPDFVNSYITHYLDWGEKLYEGSKLQHLGFHLRY
jgi:hypothetical protein